MNVKTYNDIIFGPLSQFITISQQIGAEVSDHAQMVHQAFQAQLEFLKLTINSEQPSNDQLLKFLEPTERIIRTIQSFREKNRSSKFFNHLSAVSESISALGWVVVKPAPSSLVKEMSEAGQFYTDRVLREWKETDQTHVKWVHAWLETLNHLQRFVKQYYSTGLVWSHSDVTLGNITQPLLSKAALFTQINQGEEITKNLKQRASYNQTYRTVGRAAPDGGGNGEFQSAISASILKPPVFMKEGKKWIIEYNNNNNLVVENVEMNNVVYVYMCTNLMLTVRGKLNSVVLDSCKKTSIVFDTLITSIEFINSQSLQMQVLGKVPTISIDKTDGCQIYLSKNSLDVEIISSKSSEMNVLIPKENGDYKEYPVPEQLKTTVLYEGLQTTIVKNKG